MLALEGASPANDHSTTPTVGILELTSLLLTVNSQDSAALPASPLAPPPTPSVPNSAPPAPAASPEPVVDPVLTETRPPLAALSMAIVPLSSQPGNPARARDGRRSCLWAIERRSRRRTLGSAQAPSRPRRPIRMCCVSLVTARHRCFSTAVLRVREQRLTVGQGQLPWRRLRTAAF